MMGAPRSLMRLPAVFFRVRTSLTQRGRESSAQALLEVDPAVRDRVMAAEAHPWKLLAGSL